MEKQVYLSVLLRFAVPAVPADKYPIPFLLSIDRDIA
jgi:hypothetical protein